ncbi:hypothetical protein [Bacillus toyonensis]|uniref:Uncharacterized protein n=1 Tax=Bacillus toyonensis TaxID=155322 RepID=A0AAP8EY64_9BACI|nr:hypothetical protein [Bacillus toyonensis]PKR94613.1 hypothetical protein bcere0024_051330 [Bacillus cereus Rock4-18]PEB90271.1 hypothetical protein CON81_26000 [Bacillus toyonensis]PEC07047.1 hypothetical protein CON55_31345 [Bacillus toyonensis]PED92013.1 hypothetical protein CON90_25235 [Bacillus toyonensis]PEJ59879.1 hypothetical protein CN906_28045 [Bacillus toyonensis]
MEISKYKIPSVNGEGWGVFLFDDTGIFTAITDFGNFSYWFETWNGESMKDFLSGRCPDQILCKIARENVIDVKETFKYIKEELISHRRSEYFTEEEAREQWKLIEKLKEDIHVYSEDTAFTLFYEETKIQFYDGFLRFKYPNAAVRFCNETFVRLQEKIRLEMGN